MTKEECEIETSKAIMEMRSHIVELEKENAELKEELKDADEKVVHLACNQNKDLKYKLTKAKEIIKQLLKATYGEGWNYSLQVKVEAEKFLKEDTNGSKE